LGPTLGRPQRTRPFSAIAGPVAARLECERSGKLQSISHQRRLWLTVVSGMLLLAAIGYGAYWALASRFQEFTDDAYVAGNVVQITPQISGTVVAIGADSTQFVQAGQTVVQLERADSKVALDQAEAQLARTVREARNLFSASAPGSSATSHLLR
jgi:membrane fusion protein, multidrug efflux system